MVVGATGALGSELVRVLDARDFPVSSLLPVATDQSLGSDVSFRGDDVPVAAEDPDLRGADLVFLCAPPAVSKTLVREALRVETPCIDLSGALAASPEVPLLVADLAPPEELLRQPLLAVPAGPGLAWALALDPLHRHAGLRRVVGTCLQAAASGGRAGMDSLSRETVALLNQTELPDPTVFDRSVAFDCIPIVDDAEDEYRGESAIERDLRRLVSKDLGVVVHAVRVPTFVGDASALWVETERPLDWPGVAELLAKAPGLELWERDPRGPSTRTAAGRDVVIVGRVRRDPTSERGVLLWLLADTLHLAASQAVRLAELRFRH